MDEGEHFLLSSNLEAVDDASNPSSSPPWHAPLFSLLSSSSSIIAPSQEPEQQPVSPLFHALGQNFVAGEEEKDKCAAGLALTLEKEKKRRLLPLFRSSQDSRGVAELGMTDTCAPIK